MSDGTDHELLAAWRAGDAERGNELVQRHFSSVYVFLRSKVPDQVDELVQRTFLACVEAVERIDETRSVRAYLFGIARRQLIYHFRRSQRHDARFDPMETSVCDAGGSPSRVAAARQAQAQILEALHHLPLDLQITLELHYWEDMSIAEIAVVLEIPPGTVKSRLHRARDRLKALLEAQAGALTSVDESIGHLRELRRALGPAPTTD